MQLVTAAHCVARFGQGAGSIANSVTYQPAFFDGQIPFGSWTASSIVVPISYLAGNDPCDPGAPGVICENDLAVLVIAPNAQNTLVGAITGWLG